MQPFRYVQVQDLGQAVALLSGQPLARAIAGGTNLVDMMRGGSEHPEVLVDITRLPLRGIEGLGDGGVRLGALVGNTEAAHHPLVQERCPLLARAILQGASPQIRNKATLGGNLMQRTRCAYFRDSSYRCNRRDPGAGCDARDGHHRSHAVLGTSAACIATHPSDLAVALAALDAVVHLHGPAGARSVPVTEFYRLPGATPERETVLGPGELIVGITLPPPVPGAVSQYEKARDRASFEFALASVAAVLQIEEGRVRWARLALGGVATIPWRATSAEALLVGARVTPDVALEVAEVTLADATPLAGNRFKIALARALIVRTLTELARS